MRGTIAALALLAACGRGAAPIPGSVAPTPGPASVTPPPAVAPPVAVGPGAEAGSPEPPPIRAGVAPPPGPYAPGFDALDYRIAVALPDTGTLIRGRTSVSIALVAPRRDTLPLDLTGLAVDTVLLDGNAAAYRYEAGKLRLAVPASRRPGDTVTVDVAYHGHPDDGLIIGPNVHGARAAFADNWPNRARFWFPCIDHPSDKATAEVRVTAPAGWQVVANGAPEPEGRGNTVAWRTRVAIPTYTMVLGAARMIRRGVPRAGGVAAAPEISVWLFPEDSAGARSFRRASDMVSWYAALVAPFPYEKLAHVESSTKFGGMENASAIFYDEKAIASGANIEGTVAHETAHQWFGDAVTESDWHHLWLSEGFATYFAALWFRHAEGEDRFQGEMRRSRAEYLQSADTARPVIDPAEGDLFALLNANNYQKGAWVLHMLQGQVGDSTFFRGIRAYYREHAGGNALTADLRRALEAASGQELGWFFQQWLYQPGFPRLRLSWRWLPDARAAEVTVRQVQSATWPTYRLPLELELATPSGRVRRRIDVTRREETFRLPLPAAPSAVRPDPDSRLLLVLEPGS